MEEDNDIVIEDETDSASSAAREKKLRERLKECEGKAKEYLDGWQRAQAEFVNIRKRDEEAKREFSKFISEKLISELMPVLDSFNLALSHGAKEIAPVYKQFMQILKQNGLEELDPKGEEFNPRKHESIGVIETEKKEDDHKILEVAQKGYILSGKIIRPAKVKIGQNNG